MRLIGRPELAADPRFAGREDRKRHRAALNAEIELALAARPRGMVEADERRRRAGRRGARRAVGAGASAGRRARTAADFRGRAGRRQATVSVVRSGFRLKSGDPRAGLAAAGARRRHGAPARRARLFATRDRRAVARQGDLGDDVAKSDTPKTPEDWWSTSIIDMKPGMIRFRGYAIEDLIGRVSFAEMVYLLTRGELPIRGGETAGGRAGRGGRSWPAGAVDRGGAHGGDLRRRHQQRHGFGDQHARRRAWRRGRAGGGILSTRSPRAAATSMRRSRPRSTRFEQARHPPCAGFGHRFHPLDPRAPRLLELVDAAAKPAWSVAGSPRSAAHRGGAGEERRPPSR